MMRCSADLQAGTKDGLDSIETPAAVVDLDIMSSNCVRIADYCANHGLRWRPHAKTHKSRVVAAAQSRAGASGITVATPREAELLAVTSQEILLAYPVIGDARLQRVFGMDPFPERFMVAIDSFAALDAVAAAAERHDRDVGVLIELDVGMRRTGVQTPERAVGLARAIMSKPRLRYDGVMYYPGHIRQHVSEQHDDLRLVAAVLRSFIDALSDSGLAPAIVSGGSTPTVWSSHLLTGTTDVRAGTITLGDRTTAAIGACSWSDCAYSILATVVSVEVPGQAVVDAGSKALAKEELRGTGGGSGYGALLDNPDIVVSALSEEHGILDLSRTSWRPHVGERVRVVPNHVCVSMNLQARAWGVRNGGIVTSWPVGAINR